MRQRESGNFWPRKGVQRSVRENLLKSFLAVVGGNVIYFFLLMPVLPRRGQHVPEHLDLGLLLDFWICLVLYGVIEMLWRRKKRRQREY